jgi:hypothetical protein
LARIVASQDDSFGTVAERVAPTVASLAYELSLGSLSQQEATMSELRTRTGTLVSAASIVTSFLGGAAIARNGLGGLGVILLAFIAAIALTTWILVPRRELVFAFRGRDLFESSLDVNETYRRLTYWLEGFHTASDATIKRLVRSYGFAVAAVLVEAIVWSLHLGIE